MGSFLIPSQKPLRPPLHVIAKDSLIAGKYRIIEEIGRGGMGVVYKAEDLKLKRLVALKFLPPHLMNSLELKERFIVEAQAAAALSHPNICVIHEVGEAEDQSFIAPRKKENPCPWSLSSYQRALSGKPAPMALRMA
jgi:serine/threonine protein kinase